MRLLLIEDDFDLGQGIVDGLELDGHLVSWEKQGDVGLYRAKEWEWDMIILDRLLPVRDGLEILRSLREVKAVPVLMLTALDEVSHRLEGFDLGADDYLGKPFELKELLARVKAVGRRTLNADERRIRIGEITIDLESGRALQGGKDIRLTHSEFRTLEFLVRRRGRLVSRGHLEDLLAELGRGDDIQPNALDVHMHRLRKKVGKSVIETHRGQGYFVPPEDGRL